MKVNEFVSILKNWGTKEDLIDSSNCVDGCNTCELNNKIIIGNEIHTICTIISKLNKELNQ